MPAKKSVRGTRATPARTSATSSQQGPSNADLANPQLPEVQTQQNFAYGSTKTPLLPKALKAHAAMTTAEMAQTLDEEIDHAEANLRAHVAEAAAYGRDAAGERAERARRRSQSRELREGSVGSESQPAPSPRLRKSGRIPNLFPIDAPRSDRVGSQTPLRPIREASEESPQSQNPRLLRTPTDRTVDPSELSTPEIPDWSYVQEGRHHHTAYWGNTPPPPFRPEGFDAFMDFIVRWFWYFFGRAGLWHDIRAWEFDRRPYILNLCYNVFMISLITGVMIAVLIYMNILFIRGEAIIYRNLTHGAIKSDGQAAQIVTLDHPEIPHLKDMLGNYGQRLSAIEQFNIEQDKFKAEQKQFRTEQEQFNSEQVKWRKSSRRLISPKGFVDELSTRVNYFSPGTGAVVDPYLTSPTKHRRFTFMERLLLIPFGNLRKYESRPPVEALLPWREQGDCWCSAPMKKSVAQLAVLLGHTIFPETIVVEHIHSTASTMPGSAPRHIELYAFDELAAASAEKSPGDHWELLLSFEYEAPTAASWDVENSEEHNVQEFKVPPMMRPTNKLAIRVLDNWGADVTCLYRVRVHGTPKEPHPIIRASA